MRYQFLKRFTCNHRYLYSKELQGFEKVLHGARYIYICEKCGKVKYE